MTRDKIFQLITQKKPPVIYISGVAATGKSTFGRELRGSLGYNVIELEAILLEIVKSRGLDEPSTFRKVLFEAEESHEKTLFLEATGAVTADAVRRERPTVIEGAVANAQTLERILQPVSHLFFLYFHPSDVDAYIRNITSRFMQSDKDSYAGLSMKFWRLIDDQEFETFCKTRQLTDGLKKSIQHYALALQKESLIRLDECRQRFENLIVVEV